MSYAEHIQKNYVKALKKVKTEKPQEGYLFIEIAGDYTLIFPHTEGLKVLQALGTAEKLRRYSQTQIEPTGSGFIQTKFVTPKEYENMKVSVLLNVPLYELEGAQELASKEEFKNESSS